MQHNNALAHILMLVCEFLAKKKKRYHTQTAVLDHRRFFPLPTTGDIAERKRFATTKKIKEILNYRDTEMVGFRNVSRTEKKLL